MRLDLDEQAEPMCLIFAVDRIESVTDATLNRPCRPLT